MTNRSTGRLNPTAINRDNKPAETPKTGIFAKKDEKSVGDEISGAMLRANLEAETDRWRKAG